MKFFKPEDFKFSDGPPKTFQYMVNDSVSIEEAARVANAKLEREGKVVYTNVHKLNLTWYESNSCKEDTHKALLINIEPIETCKHPKEKVCSIRNIMNANEIICWKCECGAKVQPKEFEEVK
jgi:hypothetical protein